MTTLYVYSKSRAGRKNFLTHEFTGTRSECNKFIKDRSRMGRFTHYMLISSLDRYTATKRYCDGSSWDAVSGCYTD